MMLIADTLVVIGLATASLGTIQETGGVQEHSFWLRNDGPRCSRVTLPKSSCGSIRRAGEGTLT